MKIPPAPAGTPFGSYAWADWYYKIAYLISNTDFSHNDLKNLQGGSTSERYHLTQSQHTAILNAVANNAEGTFTPTLTIGSNLDSLTAGPAIYQRIGNTVYVSGKLTFDPTAAVGQFTFTSTLPVASTLTDGLFGNFGTNIGIQPGAIYKYPTANEAYFVASANGSGSAEMYYNYMYRVTS